MNEPKTTPRTDAFLEEHRVNSGILEPLIEHARTLELELQQAQREIERLNTAMDEYSNDEILGVRYKEERDQLKQANAELQKQNEFAQEGIQKQCHLVAKLAASEARFRLATEAGLMSLRHVVSALHATGTISPDAREAINMMKDALSTPPSTALAEYMKTWNEDKERLNFLWHNRNNIKLIKRIENRDDDESFREAIDQARELLKGK